MTHIPPSLHPQELVAAGLFVGAIAAVYLFAIRALIRLGLERRGHRPAPTLRQRRLRWVLFVVAGFGVVCIAYGCFIEPYWPDVTHVRIDSAKLPPGGRPIRIVHFSDLHCDPRPRLESRLPDLITAQHPDLILYTGDSLNSPKGLPILRELLTRLAAIAPTIVVRGNWDVWFWNGLNLFGGTGVLELNGQVVPIRVDRTVLWVAGSAVDDETGIARALQRIPTGAFTILAYHYPDEIERVAARGDVDLYCAGHTHGGQIALPGYGALLTCSRFGKRYEAGLYRVGSTWLYVNRGIGMEGGFAPRARFCARPELTVIEIAPEAHASPPPPGAR